VEEGEAKRRVMGKQKVIGTCRLCLKEGQELQGSHIISGFLYKAIRGAKRGWDVYADSGRIPGRQPPQNGFHEHLLCRDCEQKRSKWETYASRLLFIKSVQPIVTAEYQDFFDIDYEQFKLFQMSLLWMLSISELDRFRAIKLTVEQEKRLREMLDRSNPGESYDYGCILEFISGTQPKIARLIAIPTGEPVVYEGHVCYRFILAGMIWVYFVSDHTDRFPDMSGFLSKSGILRISKETQGGRDFVSDLMELIVEKHKLKAAASSTAKP
jgi:hypothetical protein